jgi:hypothetical protein
MDRQRVVSFELPVDAPEDERGRVDVLRAIAILRVDDPADPEDPLARCGRVTLKKIVLSAHQAAVEVERLNSLNAGRGCHYTTQLARIELPAGAVKRGSSG